jgi:hypothetical protein
LSLTDPREAFPNTLISANKAAEQLSGTPLYIRLLALLTNIGHGRKSFPGTYALAYLGPFVHVKENNDIDTWRPSRWDVGMENAIRPNAVA